MYKMLISTISAVIIIFSAGLSWASPPASFSVSARSGNRPSLLYTDRETVRISARVEGGSGPVQVDYAARETCGKWMAKGTATIDRSGGGAAEVHIPLSFPGRGHYQLTLAAKCGLLTANESTTVAIVYPQQPATVDSPWGIMYGVYRGYPAGLDPKDRPAQIAESLRMLGASWTRLTLWEQTYKVKVENGKVVLDLSAIRRQVDEFRKRGINILGEFVQTPRMLSSKPDALEQIGDAGPLYCRVRPKDYRLWDQMVEMIAREFKDDIPVWEVWNEVDFTGHYWAGTREEYLELLDHTSAAIRRGNPNAKVAAAGFTNIVKRCAPFFDAGFGKNIDILTVHYTDKKNLIGDFLKLQKDHGLNLPIVNTEESSVIPLNNLALGIRTIKYIHMLDRQLSLLPLMAMDWEIYPTSVTYSVGAHLIGTKKFRRVKELPGFKVFFFGDEGDIAVITPYCNDSPVKLMGSITIDQILVRTVPAEGREVVGIDALGREKKLVGGEGKIPFSLMASIFRENRGMIFASPECVFLRNCKDVVSIDKIISSENGAIIVEAENGDYDRTAIIVSEKKDFSGGKFLNIWKKVPGKKGYGVDLKMNVPKDGEYRVFFSGNSLTRLNKPSSISPFSWGFDQEVLHAVGEKTYDHLGGIEGAPEGLSELGTVHLTKGDHIFHLRLTAPRETPDQCWALWIDAIALVPKH